VPFEAACAVPAGHVVRVAAAENLIEVSRFAASCDDADVAPGDVEEVARDIRAALEGWLSRLGAQFGDRPVAICLSGGLDSGLVAALARNYFSRLTAYTYSFSGPGIPLSEDARCAEKLAGHLRIPFRPVLATADELRDAVDPALCYGQDWRDFNVHCAMVNELVARAIRSDADAAAGPMPLVLTGDLANELLADYEPVPYDGQEYYKLPRMAPFDLRRFLVRGLDSGDREVGVFARHGLDVVQPYGLIADQYHRLPPAFIGGQQSKQELVRRIAGDLLPAFVYTRPKVRAQVGDATASTGILPLLIQQGLGAEWLRRAFCRLFSIDRVAFLDRFIRGGRYRTLAPFRTPRLIINGYVTG
jgi:asparagine synthetase B (glutamine-hydrolysing)